jgi:hypothetical protein
LDHKKKLIALLVLLYGIKKGHDMYVLYVKPLLELKRTFSSGLGASTNEEVEEETTSVRTLRLLMTQYPSLRTQIKVFKSTIKNITSTLMSQPDYLRKTVDDLFRLIAVKESTVQEGLTSA